MTVTFTPTSGGTKYATLTVTSTDGNFPTIPLMVNGTGTGPALSLSPSSLAFGNVNVGASSQQFLTVTNTGTAALSVGSITSSNAMFTISPSSLSLAAGAAGTVTVTFTPASATAQVGSLTINHNAAGSPATVTLSGTGASAAFPDLRIAGRMVFVRLAGNAGSIYVMNPDGSGQTPLTAGESPAWSPDGSRIAYESGSEIYVMNPDGSGQTRLAGGGIPRWSPDGGRIAYTSASEIYVMNADGTGQTRLTSNTATEFTGGWSPDGGKIVFASGRDNNPLGVPEIYVMNADGSGQTRLTVIPQGNNGPNWSPEGSRIVFHSAKEGALSLYVMGADGSGQARLTTGSDVRAHWLPFQRIGSAIVGASVSRTMTVENKGNAILSVAGIISSDAQFAISPTNLSVAAGAAGTVTVTFAPTSAGTNYSTLTITSNDPDTPTISLKVNGTGTVTTPSISLSPASLSFGNVIVGSSAQQFLTVTNTGTATLSVSSITTNNALFTLSPGSLSLAAGAAGTITVTFAPNTTGSQTATLTITHNAAGSPATVSLSGTGTTPAAPVISLSSASLSFGTVNVGASSQQFLTVTNTGTATLSVGSITSSNAMFTLSPSSLSLAAGAVGTVTVTFAPTSAGAHTGTLSIIHNAAGSPATVALIGTGTFPTLTGRVRYAEGTGAGVDGVNLTLTAAATQTAVTNAEGVYTFNNAPPSASLTAAKEGALNNAIQGADALLLLQRAAFLAPQAPAGDLSADANGDGLSNNADALAVLRYLAFLPTGTGSVGQWRFAPASPDFLAFIVGDADHGWRRALAKPGVSPATVSLGQTRGVAPDEVRIPVALHTGPDSLATFQASLEYDPAQLTFRSATVAGTSPGYLLAVNAETEGQVHLAVAGASGPPVDGAFVELTFQVRKSDGNPATGVGLASRQAGVRLLRAVVNDLTVSDLSAATVTIREVPGEVRLFQNHPNPFNPASQIVFGLPADAQVRLTIYNLLGQRVRTLTDGRLEEGYHTITWDGRTEAGARAASGVYFYRLETPGFAKTMRMVLLK